MDKLLEAGLMPGTLFVDVSGKGYLPSRGVFVGEHHQDPLRRFLEIWVAKPADAPERPKFHNEMDKRRFLLWKQHRHDPEKHIEHKFQQHHDRYSKILSWHAQNHAQVKGHPLLRHNPKDVVNKMITENGLAVVSSKGDVVTVYALKRQVPFTAEHQGRIQTLFGVTYETMVRWGAHIDAETESVQAAVVVFGEHMYSQKKRKLTPQDLKGTDAERLNTQDGEIIIDEPATFGGKEWDLGAIGQDASGKWYAVGLTRLGGRSKAQPVPHEWQNHIPQGAEKQEIADPVQRQADTHLPEPPEATPSVQEPAPNVKRKDKGTPLHFIKGHPGRNKIVPGAKIRGV